MARPSKYTPELVKRITQYIADGLTLRDACYGAGISADTLCRWRKEKPEFDEAIVKATEAQAWSSIALVKTSEYRRYTRRNNYRSKQTKNEQKGINTQLEQNEAILGLLRASQAHFEAQELSPDNRLPKRSEPPVNEFGELVPSGLYFNTTTNRVEWITKENGKCVLHTCHIDVWKARMEEQSLLRWFF